MYAALTGAATLAGLLVFGHAWEIDHRLTGVVQRITIVIGWTRVALLFARGDESPLTS